MSEPIRIDLVIDAINNIHDVIDETNDRMDEMVDAQEKATAAAERAEVQQSKSIDKMKQWAVGLAAVAAAYLSINTAVAQTREIFALGAEMDHLATQTGVAVNQLVTFEQAIQDIGAQADVGRTINFMQKQIAEASIGIGEGKIAFDQLNMSAKDLADLAPDEQFELISSKIRNIQDPAAAAAIAMRLFGESGAQLLPLIRDGGALDDARQTLGDLPDILERNAERFERIDTLLGRTSVKTHQFFAGLGDQIGDLVLAPLEEVNMIDFTAAGQNIGAFVALVADTWANGDMVELIGLTFDAGVEIGTDAMRNGLLSMMAWFETGEPGLALARGFLMGAEKIQITILDAITAPVEFGTAAFVKLFDFIEVSWDSVSNTFSEIWTDSLNWLGEKYESLINTIISGLNEIPGIEVDPITIERLEAVIDGTREAVTWEEALAAAKEQTAESASFVRDFIVDANEAAREALGSEVERNEANVSAVERLAEKLNEIKDKTDEATEAIAAGTGATAAGGLGGFEKDPIGDFIEQMEELQSVGTQVASALQTSFEGISTTINDLLMGTISWQEALTNIPAIILGAVIASFSSMAAAWITAQVAMMIANTTRQEAEATTAAAAAASAGGASVAAGVASAGAWVPAAIAASIATFGAASAAGLGGFSTAMAGGVAVASTAALISGVLVSVLGGIGSAIGAGVSNSQTGYATGGRIRGGAQLINVNETGEEEFVVNGPTTSRNSKFLDVLNRTGSVDAANAATGRNSRGGRGSRNDSAIFHAVGDRRQARRFTDRYPGDVSIRKMMRQELAAAR